MLQNSSRTMLCASFQISSPDEIDGEFIEILQESYATGSQQYLIEATLVEFENSSRRDAKDQNDWLTKGSPSHQIS